MTIHDVIADLRGRAAEYRKRAEASDGGASEYWSGRRDQAAYDADQLEKIAAYLLPVVSIPSCWPVVKPCSECGPACWNVACPLRPIVTTITTSASVCFPGEVMNTKSQNIDTLPEHGDAVDMTKAGA